MKKHLMINISALVSAFVVCTGTVAYLASNSSDFELSYAMDYSLLGVSANNHEDDVTNNVVEDLGREFLPMPLTEVEPVEIVRLSGFNNLDDFTIPSDVLLEMQMSNSNYNSPFTYIGQEPAIREYQEPIEKVETVSVASVTAKEEPVAVAVKEEPVTVAVKEEPVTVAVKEETVTVAAKEETVTVAAKEETVTVAVKEEPVAVAVTDEPVAVAEVATVSTASVSTASVSTSTTMPEGYQSKFSYWYQTNTDIRGWLRLAGTKLDYPIMQTTNDFYYLNRNEYKQSNVWGVPYMSTFCTTDSSTNTILFGHSRDATGEQLSALKSYRNIAFYKANPVIEFDTVYGDGDYKVMAYFIENTSEANPFFRYHEFIDQTDPAYIDNFITQAKLRSYINTDVDYLHTDKFLTISTCEDTNTSNYNRLVLVARKVREGESIYVDTSTATQNYNQKLP